MPLYEYRCTACGHLFECYHAVGASQPTCPRCGRESRKVYGSVGLIFKGSGFHTTDYRRAGSPDDKAAGKAADKDATPSPAPPATSSTES